jgi:hypothetical protein
MLLDDKQDCFKGDGAGVINIFIQLADLDLRKYGRVKTQLAG